MVGNKCDLDSQRAVSFEEGQELADHYCVRFLETSAKDSKNVEQAFTLMTREIKNRVAVTTKPKGETKGTVNSNQKLDSGKKIEQKKGGCC